MNLFLDKRKSEAYGNHYIYIYDPLLHDNKIAYYYYYVIKN